jgi:tetratricopeptide (TPR) repeat protein
MIKIPVRLIVSFPLLVFVFVVLLQCGNEPETLEELTSAGEKAFVDRDYARARKYLSQAVIKKSSDKHLLYLLGVSYARDFLYDSAFHYLKRADLLHPDDPEINKEILPLAKSLGEWKAAIQSIQAFIKNGEPIERYYRDLAELSVKEQNFPVAYIYYRKLLQQEPDDPDVHLQVANLAAHEDSIHVALRVIDSAIERFGEKEQFLLNKSLFLAGARRYREAESLVRSLLLKDSTKISYKLNLASVLASQSDLKKKREAYDIYRELDTILPVTDTLLDSTIAALEQVLGRSKDIKEGQD